MKFTSLHRSLGRDPGPLVDEMIADAVREGIAETDDLDWKSKAPPAKALAETDYPKDVAAMANSGGGMIVYGVTEADKKASGRVDTGDLTELLERTLRSVAVSSIHPPVFGLDIVQLGEAGNRCIAVVIPASVDGPHLIYRGEYFGAPVRNNADTVWMKERQVEAAYRQRFEERRNTTEALDRLYDELTAITKVETRAWLIAVGRPRVTPTSTERWTRSEASSMFEKASAYSLTYARREGMRPFEIIDTRNPRPGYRRWVAMRSTNGEPSWKDAKASLHFDGSVAVALAVGGQKNGPESYLPAWQFHSVAVEGAIADFMGLLREVSALIGTGDYEVRVGIERGGPERMTMWTVDRMGFDYDGASIPMLRYFPVETTIEVGVDDERFLHQVRELAQDCVNQGGITVLRTFAACGCTECAAN